MCGLWGIAGPGINKADMYLGYQMGHISQLRGDDSNGVFQVNYHTNRYVLEKDRHSWDYFYWLMGRNKSPILNDVSVGVIIGHSRSATRGEITKENAHPFVFDGTIAGAHNGTLHDVKYQDKIKTDSELMFQDISERNINNVLENLVPESAFAISMYDFRTRKLIFARNDKRTLSFAVNKDRGVLYWASELQGLKYILDRNGVKYDAFNINPGIWELDPKTIRHSIELLHKVTNKVEPEVIKEEKKPVVNNVVHIHKKEKEVSPKKGKSFSSFCSVCDERMDPAALYNARAGLAGEYDQKMNEYFCASCVDPNLVVATTH